MSKVENPGALAGATGANSTETAFRSGEYARRAQAATALCVAIGECHRDDVVKILDAALSDLSMGAPLPGFCATVDEARWWSYFASPLELKAYALSSYEAMPTKTKAAFRAHIGRNLG